jgi:hypothetical protein
MSVVLDWDIPTSFSLLAIAGNVVLQTNIYSCNDN